VTAMETKDAVEEWEKRNDETNVSADECGRMKRREFVHRGGE
jgi:hypothetical protein